VLADHPVGGVKFAEPSVCWLELSFVRVNVSCAVPAPGAAAGTTDASKVLVDVVACAEPTSATAPATMATSAAPRKRRIDLRFKFVPS